MYDDLDDDENDDGQSMQGLDDESSYICDSCGEEIVVPIDSSEGHSQRYVEDCPVCCCPNVIEVQLSPNGEIDIRSHRE